MGQTDFPISGIPEISGNVASLKSHAAHLALIMYNMPCATGTKEQLSINLDGAEVTFILALFRWVKPLMKERKTLKCPEKNPNDEPQKTPHTKV